jgi:hypothetical protein
VRRADVSSRGVLPILCVSEYDREASIMRRPWPTTGCCALKENLNKYLCSYCSVVSFDFIMLPVVSHEVVENGGCKEFVFFSVEQDTYICS